MDLNERRELNNGFGDSLARAFELVVTPILFGFLGLLLDHKLHTRPWFMFGFGIWAFSYTMWKLTSGYGRAMDEHQQRLRVRRNETEVDRRG